MIIGKLCHSVIIIKKLLKHWARESPGWVESGGISLPELSNYSREISVDVKTLKFNELSGFKVS